MNYIKYTSEIVVQSIIIDSNIIVFDGYNNFFCLLKKIEVLIKPKEHSKLPEFLPGIKLLVNNKTFYSRDVSASVNEYNEKHYIYLNGLSEKVQEFKLEFHNEYGLNSIPGILIIRANAVFEANKAEY